MLALAGSRWSTTAAEAPVVLAENGIATAVIVVEKSLLPRPEGPAKPMRGRYVRLEQPSDRVMVAEVEVFSGGVNVAIGKPATQKGQWGGCAAGRAVDGDRNANEDRCAIGDPVGWWEVDLGATLAIEKIVTVVKLPHTIPESFQQRLRGLAGAGRPQPPCPRQPI